MNAQPARITAPNQEEFAQTFTVPSYATALVVTQAMEQHATTSMSVKVIIMVALPHSSSAPTMWEVLSVFAHQDLQTTGMCGVTILTSVQ